MKRSLGAGLLGVLCAAAQAVAQQTPAPIVIRGAAVLTMQTDTILPDQAVVVRGSTIEWVGPASETPNVPDAVVIEARGRFLLPGLADMHAHMTPEDVPLFLANGITTVREMNGAAVHLALRDSIATGLRIGPRMIVASPLLAGTEQRWRHVLVADAETAYEAAHRIKADGYDALKVYDGLSGEAYGALVEAGKTLGLDVVGHVPEAVGLEGVLAAGQRSIEHVEQIAYATVDHAPDPAAIPAIASRIAAAESWVVPTLAAQRILAERRTRAYNARFDSPEMRYVDPGLRAWWESLRATEGAADPPPDDPRRRNAEAFYGFQRVLTRALYEAGVPLLVGTDTPNPLLVPGFSIHIELATLVEAGIPPLDVLRMATREAARFMDEDGKWGVIATGAPADLVLVAENPLVQMEALKSPLGVMVRGTWLGREDLERMLAEGEARESP